MAPTLGCDALNGEGTSFVSRLLKTPVRAKPGSGLQFACYCRLPEELPSERELIVDRMILTSGSSLTILGS